MDQQIEKQLSGILRILKKVRHKHGFSQEYIRNRYGIDVSRIESGECYPGIKNYHQLCEGYEICPGWLWILSSYVEEGELSQKEMEEIVIHWRNYKESAKAISNCFVSMIKEFDKDFPKVFKK